MRKHFVGVVGSEVHVMHGEPLSLPRIGKTGVSALMSTFMFSFARQRTRRRDRVYRLDHGYALGIRHQQWTGRQDQEP